MIKHILCSIKHILFSIGFFTLMGGFMHQDNQKIRTLHTATEKDFRSALPHLASDYHSMQLVNMLYDGLLRKDSDGKVIPAIAESYDVSEDQKTYTFHLKKNFWSNGDLLTAKDFESSWKKMLDPRSGFPLSSDFHPIKNGKKCLEGKVSVDSVGIYAKDCATLIVELENPNRHFPSFVASSTYRPMHSSAAVNQQIPIGNGPFLLKEWKLGYSLQLAKNPTYWDSSHVQLDAIEIQVIPDPTTQLYLYDKGDLDYIGGPLSDFSDPNALQERAFKTKETSSVACL
ncbi:MAG: ABC transporter substrate-binding protein, partial [Chlamydiota bacterium]